MDSYHIRVGSLGFDRSQNVLNGGDDLGAPLKFVEQRLPLPVDFVPPLKRSIVRVA